MASNAALPRRIVKETQMIMSNPPPGISATPQEDNLRYFNVVIAGPSGSPFEGGVFKMELFLVEDYPMSPPKVRFLSKVESKRSFFLTFIVDLSSQYWQIGTNLFRYLENELESSTYNFFGTIEYSGTPQCP
jgi:hypothetical protein